MALVESGDSTELPFLARSEHKEKVADGEDSNIHGERCLCMRKASRGGSEGTVCVCVCVSVGGGRQCSIASWV